MKRNFRKLVGSPWLGANFWSRVGGPLMWREPYDGKIVRAELRTLREHGLNTTRSFFYWPDFMPAQDRIDEDCVARFQDFLEAHREVGLGTIPTFIVGHMSGENWDPAWREGRDLYGDVWLVGRQAWFAEQLTRRFHEHPAVVGWLITNEMPLYGGTAERPVISAWAQLMVQAVRAGGATQPISVGDGAWGAEVTGEHNGFSVRDLAAFTDFVGPHVYRMEDDVVRQHYAAAFVCELTGGFDRPVVLEEFGVTSEYVADDHAAHYYRQVLYNSLLAGATGWLAWNNTDLDLINQDPYRHHPFELHFGLTTVDGTPKPQLREMAEFAATLREIDVEGCERVKGDAVLVVPEVMEGDVPFTYPEERTHIFTTLRQAYVAARAADLPIGVTRERDGIAGGASLYLVPSTKQLTAPGWHRLEALAEAGAVVYVSYSPGTQGIQRGPWYSHMNAMFGVEHRLRYGLTDPVEDDVVELTFQRDLGSIPAGTSLSFNAAGNAHSRSYLPVRPVEAEVVAVDQHGRPALLRRGTGAGWLVLGTFPLEHMAALTPRVNPEPTYRLYDALAELAGVSRPVTVDDPRVSVDLLEHEGGARYAFLVSQSEDPLTIKADGLDEPVSIPPYGVRVVRL